MKLALALFTFAFCIFNFQFSKAQNIGIGTNTPHASAAIDVTSTNSGFLPPRMTFAQRNAIVNPASGLIVFCTNCDSSGQPQFYNGTKWCNMLGGTASGILTANLPSVNIGTQIWSSKNLDVRTYRNGDPIPQVTNATQWANLTIGAWCWYNNDSANYATTYGRLYNWYAVNDPRGLAPQGWHVPTDAEWNRLTKFIDQSADTTQCCSNVAGTAMKSIAGWSNNGNGTNTSGFNALPGGFRFMNYWGLAGLNGLGFSGYWWSSTSYDQSASWCRSLTNDNNVLQRFNYDLGLKTSGFSVRVVKD